MTFAKFCEAVIGRPLFEWEKKLTEFLKMESDFRPFAINTYLTTMVNKLRGQ